jgi:hypothetical membrane protein
MNRRALLAAGALASLLYVAMTIIGALQWPEYSSNSQTISELSAVGAPSRPTWVVLGIVYQLLMCLFGWGVWVSAGNRRWLRIAGALLLVYAVVGLAAPFTPMHLRGTPPTSSDTMHKALTAVTVLSMFLAIGFTAAAAGTRLRLYSIATIVVVLGFSGMAGLNAPRLEANLPTPGVGILERIGVFAFLLWVAVLALVLGARGVGPAARQG